MTRTQVGLLLYELGSPLASFFEKELEKAEVDFVIAEKESYEEAARMTPGVVLMLGRQEYIEKYWLERGVEVRIVIINEEENIDKLQKEAEEKNHLRIIVGQNVYGEFCPSKVEHWIPELFFAAVANRTLHVPKGKVKLLWIEDFVEAAMRACFFGIKEKLVYLAGKEIEGSELAHFLFEAAQMTHREIEEYEIESESNILTPERLRWVPKKEVTKERLETSLRAYFSRLDEYLRSHTTGEEKKSTIQQEVQIEEIEQKKEVEIVKEEPVIAKEEKIEVEEEEEIDEIPRIGVPLPKDVQFEVPEISLFAAKKQNLTNPIETLPTDLVEKMVEKVEEEARSEVILVPKQENKKKWKVNIRGIKIKYFLIVYGVISLISLSVVGTQVWGFYRFAKTELPGYINNNEWDKADESVKEKEKYIEDKLATLEQSGAYVLPGGRSVFRYLKVVDAGLGVVKNMVDLGKKSELVLKNFWLKTDDGSSVGNNYNDLFEEVSGLSEKLSYFQTQLPEKTKYLSLVGLDSQKMEELKVVRGYLEEISQGENVWREVLALDGKRREFLVLFQNEMELRPTGGFIGSYAVLTVENGRLIDFKVNDVYETDGQVAGFVTPPEAIKNYLGEASWHMRDANFNPHFVASAKDIRWFYEKATGRKVDGVIGITLASVEKILAAVGPVKVPDFSAEITKDNLYEQAEFFAETNFSPGSKQKQSFLGLLSRYLLNDLRDMPSRKYVGVLKAFLVGLDTRDTQIALNDSKAAITLARMGWDGSLQDGQCEGNCYPDYLYINEANLGVNKANFFVYRNIQLASEINQGNIDRTLFINYENTSKNTTWPAGEYKAFVRIYVPREVEVKSIYIQETDNPNNKLVLDDKTMKINSVMGKKEISFWMSVPVSSKRTVEVTYGSEIDDKINGNDFNYLLYWQRQSGYGKKTQAGLRVNVPEGWQVMGVEPEGVYKNNSLNFKLNFVKDQKIGVRLGK